MEAKEVTATAREFAVNLSVNAGIIKATLGRSGSSKTTSVEMTFAYLLLKIDWNSRVKSNRTAIVDRDDEQWSLS